VILVGTVDLFSTKRLVFCSSAIRKTIWAPNDNSEEGNVPQSVSVLLRLL